MGCMSRLTSLASAAIFGVTAFLPAAAFAGSAAEGQEIANRWCSGCHKVETGDKPSASDMVPTFGSIARRKNFDRVQLEAWIGHPHPPMPTLNLTRDEIESLVNYIESLRTPR